MAIDKQTYFEKTVLAEIMLLDNGDQQLEALCELTSRDFKDEVNQRLFKDFSLLAQQQKKIDSLTLLDITKDQGYISAAEIAKMTMNISSSAFLQDHIKVLKERRYKREVEEIVEAKLKSLKETTIADEVDLVKEGLVADLSRITLEHQSDFVDLEDMKRRLLENMEGDKKFEGYSWGHSLQILNAATSGIAVPRMIVLGALKKAGKTRFMTNTMKELYYQSVPTAFMSLEMPPYEVNRLLVATFCQINDSKLRNRQFLNRQELERLDAFKLDESLIKVECTSGLKPEEVLLRLRRYAKMGIKVVFIDYLQRIEVDAGNKANELEDISKAIADASRKYDITVILLSQLNNTAEREAPTTGHLKGSGGIGEAADIIILLDNVYRRTKDLKAKIDDEDSPLVRVDLIIDQRYGESHVLQTWADLGKCHFDDTPLNVETDEETEERLAREAEAKAKRDQGTKRNYYLS